MKKKKGYQLFDVPNNKRGRRFFEDLQEFLNTDWYGYQRRGRLPKPGVQLNSQKQARAEDSSRWAIYIRGVPTPKKFIENSKVQEARRGYKYYRELHHKTCIHNNELKNKYEEEVKNHNALNEWTYKETCDKDIMLHKHKISLFGWNISLWRNKS